MKGGTVKVAILSFFFSGWSTFSPWKKSALTEAPFNLFWTLTMILAIFVFWKNYETFLVQNLGHNLHKKCKIVIFWSSLSEKQPFTFKLFFGRLKTLLDTLTYSAMFVCEKQEYNVLFPVKVIKQLSQLKIFWSKFFLIKDLLGQCCCDKKGFQNDLCRRDVNMCVLCSNCISKMSTNLTNINVEEKTWPT